jgi:hypothetical protein
MDQHPCAGKLSDEIGSAYPTLEVHAFPDAPLLRGSLKAGLLRIVSEEAKHRFSVLHVPKSSKREDRRLPGHQAPHHEDVCGASPGYLSSSNSTASALERSFILPGPRSRRPYLGSEPG